MIKTIDQLIEENIAKYGEAQFANPKDLSMQQKSAIIKAVIYMLSADNIITSEERDFFVTLTSELGFDKEMIATAISLSDEDMFSLLRSVDEGQTAYVTSILAKAAYADGEFAKEEEELLSSFKEVITTEGRPKDFHYQLLNI